MNNLLGSVLTVLLFCNSLQSAATESLQSELTAASGVVIRFQGIESFFSTHNFSQNVLRERLESRLRAAGIRVVGASSSADDPEALILTLKFHVNQNPMYLPFLVYLKVQARRELAGHRGYVFDELWSEWKHGMTEREHLDRMYPYILEMLDDFLQQVLGYVPVNR